MQHLLFVGTVVADAETKTFGERLAINFKLVSSEKWTNKEGEKMETPSFVPFTYWVKATSKIAQYITKGTTIGVTFKINNDKYEKDGVKTYGYKFNVIELQLMGGKKSSDSSSAEPDVVPGDDVPVGSLNEDGLPF